MALGKPGRDLLYSGAAAVPSVTVVGMVSCLPPFLLLASPGVDSELRLFCLFKIKCNHINSHLPVVFLLEQPLLF